MLMLAAARGDDTGHTTPLTPAVAAAGKVFHEKRCGPLHLFGSRGGVAAAGVRRQRRAHVRFIKLDAYVHPAAAPHEVLALLR
jgi:hypothetical protein